MKKEEIEKILSDCRDEDMMSMHSVEKHNFQSLIAGMMSKLVLKKGEEAQRQYRTLQRMDNFLERLTYMNVIQIMQAKLITRQDQQIVILQQEKRELEEEIINLKKRIK